MLTAREFFQIARSYECLQSFIFGGGTYVQIAEVMHILSAFSEGIETKVTQNGDSTKYTYSPIDNGLPSTDVMDMTVFADRIQTYIDSSKAEKQVIRNMCRILRDSNSDEQERDMATSTILEALHELNGDGDLLNDLGEPT